MNRIILFFMLAFCCLQTIVFASNEWQNICSTAGIINSVLITKTNTTNLHVAANNYNIYTTYDISASPLVWSNNFVFSSSYQVLDMAAFKDDQNIVYAIIYCNS